LNFKTRTQLTVFYYIRDSIVYIERQGEYSPKLGNFIGQFTNEISPELGSHIVEWVSCGPKNYAYMLDSGHTEAVVKGISFNYLTSLKINFESMKHMITQNPKETILVPQQMFTRNTKTWECKTPIVEKLYRYVYDKRVVNPITFETLPYGF
jgi:hypothetical protein